MAVRRTIRQKSAADKATARPRRAPDSLSRPRAHPRTRSPTSIATRLEEDIVLGRRHPRERLIEQELCDRFDTHRGDVRLALFELEKKGIVERIPNRGAIVRDLTPKEVLEIYAVREELEVMAVRILPFPVAREQPFRACRAFRRSTARRSTMTTCSPCSTPTCNFTRLCSGFAATRA